MEQTPTGPNAMLLRERCLVILLDGGFAPHLAARLRDPGAVRPRLRDPVRRIG
jgi:hypothetical protein